MEAILAGAAGLGWGIAGGLGVALCVALSSLSRRYEKRTHDDHSDANIHPPATYDDPAGNGYAPPARWPSP